MKSMKFLFHDLYWIVPMYDLSIDMHFQFPVKSQFSTLLSQPHHCRRIRDLFWLSSFLDALFDYQLQLPYGLVLKRLGYFQSFVELFL